MTQNKTYIFNVIGMSCNSCVELIESELKEHHKIVSVKPILKNNSVEINGDFGDMELADIVKELNTLLSNHTLTIEKQNKEINWKEFFIAVPIALCFAFLFVLLQKLGIVNLIGSGKVTYGTAFIVGVVASLSTCMAVVGGLVLSISTTFARAGDKIRPQLLFHIGRIISFFIFGGIIGALGSAFQLSPISSFVISIIIGFVMLILGINLLDIFAWTKRLQPSMPKILSKQAFNVIKINHILTPALIGIATFFLPCGFTQSMQIYTLSTGSFFTGALIMLSFALGTLPALALLSFSSVSIKNNSKAGIFFKSIGLIIIIFALFNIFNSFSAIDKIKIDKIKPPVAPVTQNKQSNVSIVDGRQVIEIYAKGGYSPKNTIAKAGVLTSIKIKTNGTFDCSSAFTIPSLKYYTNLAPTGDKIIDIPVQKNGATIRGVCAMGMYSFIIDFKD